MLLSAENANRSRLQMLLHRIILLQSEFTYWHYRKISIPASIGMADGSINFRLRLGLRTAACRPYGYGIMK